MLVSTPENAYAPSRILQIMEWGAITLLLSLMLPFLLLMLFFNHAFYDEYYFMWLIRTQGFWGFQIDNYQSWSGRYSTTFIVAIYAYLFESRATGLLNFLVLCFGMFTIYRFLRTLILKQHSSISRPMLITLLIIWYWFILADNIGQTFYWYSSHLLYVFPQYLTLWLVMTLASLPASSGWKRIIKIVLASLLIILVTGSNEINAMALFIMMSFGLLADLIYLKRMRWTWLGLGVLHLLCFCITVFAPGNFNRQKADSARADAQIDLIQSLSGASKQFLELSLEWSQSFLLVAIILLLLISIRPSQEWINRYRKGWWLLLGLIFSGFILVFLNVLMGHAIYGRSLEARALFPSVTIFLATMLTMIISARYLIAYHDSFNPRWALVISLLATASIIFQPRYRLAWQELLFIAPAYERTLNDAYSIMKKHQGEQEIVILVPALPNQRPTISTPAVFYSADPDDDRINAYAAYWKIKHLKVNDASPNSLP